MQEQAGEKSSVLEMLTRWLPARFRRGIPVVPVVRLNGVIGAVTPLRPGLSLAGLARTLERAFAVKNAKAAALAINSPGGSPVQSRLIYLRIRQLAAEKKLPVIAFVEDVAASGGYMLACAADEIYCDPSSILGSIGVVGGTFGFPELLKKIGVERRLYTAGEHKAQLDPFLPEDPDDVARVKALQREIHGIFISLVKDTSLAATIQVPELFRQAQLITARTYEIFAMYLSAAAIYWIVSTLLAVGQGWLERRVEARR